MIRHILLAAAAAASLGGPALAQGLSVTDIDPSRPFGEVDVTLTMVDPRTVAAWMTVLDEAQQADVRARCDVMIANPDRYDVSYRVWCLALKGE